MRASLSLYAVLAIGLLASTMPAHARYCPIHDPIATLHMLMNSDKTEKNSPPRYIVHGRLVIDPKRTWKSKNYKSHYYLKGYLRGKSLSEQGFVNAFEAPVSVTSMCETVSCDFLEEDVLVIIYKQRGRYVIFNDNACDLGIYTRPTQDSLDGMVDCLRGDGCAVTDKEWYGIED